MILPNDNHVLFTVNMSHELSSPNDDCLFLWRGRCLYEEHLNPGYHTAWQCAELLHWQEEYDVFLCRAEMQELSAEEASAVWKKQFEEILSNPYTCPRFSYKSGEEPPECSFRLRQLCLLGVPACTKSGTCPNYKKQQLRVAK